MKISFEYCWKLFRIGPISSSFDGFFVVIYVTYFGLAICMIVGAHTVSFAR